MNLFFNHDDGYGSGHNCEECNIYNAPLIQLGHGDCLLICEDCLEDALSLLKENKNNAGI